MCETTANESSRAQQTTITREMEICCYTTTNTSPHNPTDFNLLTGCFCIPSAAQTLWQSWDGFGEHIKQIQKVTTYGTTSCIFKIAQPAPSGHNVASFARSRPPGHRGCSRSQICFTAELKGKFQRMKTGFFNNSNASKI